MKRKRTMNGLTPGYSRWILFTVWLTCLTPVFGWADSLSLPRLYTPESRLTPPDVHPGVYGKLYRPAASGPAPAVVILHGRSGIFPDYRQLAQTLSIQGYVALVLDYNMESGGVPPGDEARRKTLWPIFEQTVQHSIRYLQERPDVDADRIGIVGLSQGATLAISTAGITPAVKVVVAHYGRLPGSFDQIVDRLPPLLLLHGEADRWHKIEEAQKMYDALKQRDKPVAMQVYPGAPHGFNVRSQFYQPQAAADAEQRMLDFLAHYLHPSRESLGQSASQAGSMYADGFHDAVLHFYTVDLPDQMSMPGGSVERLFDLPVFAREQYAYTDEYNRVSDYNSQRQKLAQSFANLAKYGIYQHHTYKIERIALTDDTHGTVTYTTITTQFYPETHTHRLIMQSGLSHWENLNGRWQLVSVKEGSPYRVASYGWSDP